MHRGDLPRFISFHPDGQADAVHEIIVTNKVRIEFTHKCSPRFWFGNLDDPAPPADYRPNDPHRSRKWYWRNPAHNFNFYVIGMADKTFRHSGRCPGDVFNPRGGWNYCVCKYKFLRLPFIEPISQIRIARVARSLARPARREEGEYWLKSLTDEQRSGFAKELQPLGLERSGGLALLLLSRVGITTMLLRRAAPYPPACSSAGHPYL